MRSKAWLSVILSTAAWSAAALEKPPAACSYEGFNASPKVATIVAKSATGYFGCSTEKNCLATKLASGDPVLVYRADGEWTCGYLTARDGAGPGWVRSAEIRLVDIDPTPPLTAWAGTWKGGEDSVTIKPSDKPGQLDLNGAAEWQGRADVVHTGDFSGSATPAGNHVHFAEDGAESCTIDLTLAGQFIIASDNERCGGMNVRFQGIWKRASVVRHAD
jgi:hypothetical protein